MKNNNAAIKITLIAIGDELLDGFTRDTNANWLAQFLFEKGAPLNNVVVVRDNTDEIISALTQAYKNSNIVITCGGIGPTLDDKTKASVALYFKQELIDHAQARQVTINNYSNKHKQWQANQNNYNMFPRDFLALNNSSGFAPGLFFEDEINNQLIFSLPGVPREFISMIEEEVFPILLNKYASSFTPQLQTVIQTFGVPEEKIFFELCPSLWQDLEQYGKVSSLPQSSGIKIVIGHHSSDLKLYYLNHQKILALLAMGPLHDNIWNIGQESLPEAIVNKARKHKVTFAFAESCTGGLLSSKITDVPGSSEVFLGGIISYTNEVKITSLNVKKETIDTHTAVSLETACEMALGVREKTNSTFGLSITGIAGPTGEMPGIPIGTVIIGMSSKSGTHAKEFHFFGDRKALKERFSEVALLELWKLVTNK